MERTGIGPNENVFAEIGTSWWYVMRYPDQAAHFLGKLLRYVGEDNVLWGTDCLFYGIAPADDPGDAGVPDLAGVPGAVRLPQAHAELKAKILGLNGAALYGVDPTDRCEFTRRELEQIRRAARAQQGARSDHDGRDQAFRDDDREQWAAMASMLA